LDSECTNKILSRLLIVGLAALLASTAAACDEETKVSINRFPAPLPTLSRGTPFWEPAIDKTLIYRAVEFRLVAVQYGELVDGTEYMLQGEGRVKGEPGGSVQVFVRGGEDSFVYTHTPADAAPGWIRLPGSFHSPSLWFRWQPDHQAGTPADAPFP